MYETTLDINAHTHTPLCKSFLYFQLMGSLLRKVAFLGTFLSSLPIKVKYVPGLYFPRSGCGVCVCVCVCVRLRA